MECNFDPDIHLPAFKGTQKKILVEASEQVALRFCSPVYLVGSSIWNLYPNDIDIYIAVNEQTYLRLFTNYNRATESEENHLQNMRDMRVQQAKIYKKQKEYFMNRIKGWDFDVKFQDVRQFKQHKENKVRLDTVFKELW